MANPGIRRQAVDRFLNELADKAAAEGRVRCPDALMSALAQPAGHGG